MKRIFIPFLLFLTGVAFAQPALQIEPLPRGVDTNAVPDTLVERAFNVLHGFCESIYNPIKISRLTSQGYEPRDLNDALNPDRWGKGAWGRGHFSRLIDFNLYFPGKTVFYDRFWNPGSDTSKYWSTHPMISFCARVVVAYMHRYASVTDRAFKEKSLRKIKDGLRFLIRQQRQDGGYIQWHWRAAQDQPDIGDSTMQNDENAYDTGESLRALSEGYFFLRSVSPSDPKLIADVKRAVRRGADFFRAHDDSRYPKNYVAFSIWGLASAYRVTRDKEYLDCAIEKFGSDLCGSQDATGAWYRVIDNVVDYHDAAPWYAGIILRAMVELFSVIPPGAEGTPRAQIQEEIYSSINHFLLPDVTAAGGARLTADGRILKARREENPDEGPFPASLLVDGLYYAAHCPGLFASETDRGKVQGFLNSVVRMHITDAIANCQRDGNVDDNIELIALYGDRRPWRYFPRH